MSARRRMRSLLLSSSAMTLLVGAGMPSAWAASCVHTISSAFDNPAAHTTANVCVQNTSFTGNITNEGTISPSGIALVNGTITGQISSTGVINGGISLDGHSAIIANGTAIFVSGPTFTGGISNAGKISAAGTGILAGLGSISTFSGGIANTGTISAFSNGIVVGGAGGPPGSTLSAFSGGISNGGMITTTSRNGIIVGGTATNAFHIFSRSGTISTFAGGISNSGTISSLNANGIIVGGKATFGQISILSFSGGITNSGAIKAGYGIVAGGLVIAGPHLPTSAASVSISNFSGGISNSGTITAHSGSGILLGGAAAGSGGSGAAVTISTFSGGISNSGTIAAHLHGIMVGGTALAGGSVIVSSFSGGISNSAKISSGVNGIIVGGLGASGARVAISSFSGGITNSGAITAGHGIVVGGEAGSGSSVSISNFSGGISNASAIAAHTGSGILVGGLATASHAAVTISTFAGGITNGGTITAHTSGISPNGIFVGGTADLGASVSISSFAGGISNAGTISSALGNGIVVGGLAFGIASATSLSISNFSGGISNSGAVTARDGILVGGFAFGSGASVTISSFAGGITNAGTITARTNGIFVGGTAIGASVSISSFAGGISNSGSISAGLAGIWLGGLATAGSVSISNFSGGISNSGSITAGLVGILVGGVSSSRASIAISTFSGGITNSGMISASGAGIAVAGVSTFLGNISNSGVIAANGVGIDICGCATMVGGGIVNTGMIVANTGIAATNSSPINIFNSGTIVGTGGTAVDLTAASGGNTFTLGSGYSITGNVLAFAGGNDTLQLGGVGSGSFDLSSVGPSAQYQNFANFNVVSGIWTVFNTFGQSQAWNVDGGILAGTGTLSALNVNNGGTLLPGNIGAPGTFMTVTGDLNFEPGATYLVDLDPTAASRVNVGGAATLAGAVDGFLSPGSYSGKTTYDILDPTSISGTFTGFTALNAPGFSGTLTYLPNEVLLNLTAQLGLGGNLNVNQQNVANGINNFFNNGGTLPANFFPFFTLAASNLGKALTQLDGEDATDAHFGVFQQMNQFLNLMLDPWVDGRHGGGDGALGFAPDREANFPPDVALAYADVLKAPPKATFDDRWTAWGSAFGGTGSIAGDPVIGSTNVTASDYGFAAGMDYRASPDTILGFALAGGGTGWNVAQGLGTGRSDAFMAGAYGTTYWGPAYLAGAVAFANHWLTTSRTALGDQLTANFTGQDLAGRVEAGYRYAVPIAGAAIGVAPYGALQTQWFHTPTYSETDLSGGGFALTYNAATVSDTRGELGARVDDLVTLADRPLLLHGRLAWAHDWISGATQTAAFQALPGSSFSVSGANGPADSALTTAMAEWQFRPRWSLTAKFDGEFARGAQTYAGTGMLRYWW